MGWMQALGRISLKYCNLHFCALKCRSVRYRGTEDILKGCSFSLLQLLMQVREKHSDLSGGAEKENQPCQQTPSAWSFCVTYLFFHLNLFCSRQGLIHLPATAAHCSEGTSVTAGDRWWVSAGQQGGKGCGARASSECRRHRREICIIIGQTL